MPRPNIVDGELLTHRVRIWIEYIDPLGSCLHGCCLLRRLQGPLLSLFLKSHSLVYTLFYLTYAMSTKFILAVALSTAIATAKAANLHDVGVGRRHNDIIKRSAPFSFYDITTGEVACGGFYSPDDHV